MKECMHKKRVFCFQEGDFKLYLFLDRYPDNFKNDKEFLKHIKKREEHGCKKCHFFKSGFKKTETAKVMPIDCMALAC